MKNKTIIVASDEVDNALEQLEKLGLKMDDVWNEKMLPEFKKSDNNIIIIMVYGDGIVRVHSCNNADNDTETLNEFIKLFKENQELQVISARQILKDAGYFVDNLWNVRDVIDVYTEQDGSQVSEEKAYEILKEVLENPFMIENINEQILFSACEYSSFNLIKTR